MVTARAEGRVQQEKQALLMYAVFKLAETVGIGLFPIVLLNYNELLGFPPILNERTY